ncbi:tapasin isoform X1 [Rhinatrema bivittatum]|uniref:tapasin isoform X1 n=1 Tax=Rhinatrema bivittatum TaxID=194408 RepID=UPI00112E3762|nr:tapasin isoform X1 [Rhinatrema bivittatum]
MGRLCGLPPAVAAVALLLLLCPATAGKSSLGPLVECWFVEEAGGRVGSFPSAISQKRALLLLRENGHYRIPLDFTPPEQLQSGMVFDLVDPTLLLLDPAFHASPDSKEEEEAPSCEINRYSPQAAFVDWALSLTEEQHSPVDLGTEWFSSSLHSPGGKLSVATVQQAVYPPGVDRQQVTSTVVALHVFTRTPTVTAQLGQDVLLHCGFSFTREGRFSLEWRYQFRGSGHVVQAYDGVRDRVLLGQEGTELFFSELHGRGNASLRIRGAAVVHEGTYLCSVYTPYLQAQRGVELRIQEPPAISLSPDPLFLLPGQQMLLQCEVSRYYPLELAVEWLRRRGGEDGVTEYVSQAWQTGHKRNADQTFNVSSFVRVEGSRQDHGDKYTCHVSHASLRTGARKSLRLKVAGESGLCIDTVIGLFLTALVLYGFLKFASIKVCPALFTVAEESKEKSA